MIRMNLLVGGCFQAMLDQHEKMTGFLYFFSYQRCAPALAYQRWYEISDQREAINNVMRMPQLKHTQLARDTSLGSGLSFVFVLTAICRRARRFVCWDVKIQIPIAVRLVQLQARTEASFGIFGALCLLR